MVKSAAILLLFFYFQSSFAFQVNVVTRNNLKFQAASVEASTRDQEAFDIGPTDSSYESLIVKSAMDVAALFPAQYLPPSVSIILESEATYTNAQGLAELIPMSVFLSTQIPGRNQIRICDHEIKSSPDAARTIVAHEMGHMIIEWAWRAAGTVPPGQLFGWLWKKSIYEGVADYISATVNKTTSITGGLQTWYGRDILTYPSYEEAKKQSLQKTVQNIKSGLGNEGLLQYKTYSFLIRDIETELRDAPPIPDSNAEGSWLAGQLWILNAKYGEKSVIEAILKIAFAGQKKNDIEGFLVEVKSLLSNELIF